MSCQPQSSSFQFINTHFLSLTIALADLSADPVGTVESALGQVGDPLRWAITQVDDAAGLATVEAVVTTADSPTADSPTAD